MLKFNLTQEGKNLIDALQGDTKLTITKVLLRCSRPDNNTSKEITSFKGAVCNDGTGNGAYVVIDINDNSNSNYSCNVIELFSDQTKIATQCVGGESGYEVTLYCGDRGKNEYPSITYRTQTWKSGKIPTEIQLSNSMSGEGKQCGISMSGGGVEGGSATFDFENGNFPKTITFANGDIWVTNETVSATGVTKGIDYYASAIGETSIRPLFSKVLIQKESNKQLKLRVSCQFDGAEKCKFNTTSINLPYATKFRDGVVRLADPSGAYGTDGQRYNTVYSAKDVDDKISAVTGSLGNLKDYAKINAENTFAENNVFSKSITVNVEIGGKAVTEAGADGDKHIVNVGYADNKYLTKTDAGNTYLSKTAASETYLTKTDAGNYAKLDAENKFTGKTNTFNVVEATKFSGDGVATPTIDPNLPDQITTTGAVKTYVDGNVETLNGNITDLQSQIDGINAGQNLADIVNKASDLETYDVSHLKAKGDFQHGSTGAEWAIGDKVQVLGGGDAQSCVYELIKGKKPDGETNSIQSTKNADYYWHYIGVYGTNAYTKAEINDQLGKINTAIGTKADKSYVDTELDKKVNKSQIVSAVTNDASDTQVPSSKAVKTYVDGKVDGINTDLQKYVTLGTDQDITGVKTFKQPITISNPNAAKDKHYVIIGASGDNAKSDYTSSVNHFDLTHNDSASDRFMRARGSDDVFYTSDITRFSQGGDTLFNTRLEQQIGTHYKYTASDVLITTNTLGVPGAQIGTPGNTESTDTTLTENYVERIRLRKNTSVAGDADTSFLPNGQSVSYIDLFADNINNVFNKEASFRVCTTSGEGVKTDKSVLSIHSTGVYYHTQEDNSISEQEYQLRTAGSLDFTKDMSTLVGSDSYVPTTKAVADFVDNKITGITGGTAFVKTSAHGTNQTIDSAITVTEGITVGSDRASADLTVFGIITGNAVSSNISEDVPNNGTKLPTCTAVATFVDNAIAANQDATSDKTKIGAMGLFLYTGGDLKEMGTEVNGTSLQAVGMQLPMDGVVSWSQGATMEGEWKLLNNTIAGEPCLVLAIRIA